MKQQILSSLWTAIDKLGLEINSNIKEKISISNPDPKLGDFASNAALILAKVAGKKPVDLAQEIIDNLDKSFFEKVETAGAGFINFRVKDAELIKSLTPQPSHFIPHKDKILLEYFQPNIAKPLHIGHLRTAFIGDSLKRMMKYAGWNVESDTHLGDWGTQFGVLILAYKKYGNDEQINKDPIGELNKLYIKLNQEMEGNEALYEEAKQEFVKLEKNDTENRKIWERFTSWSLEVFDRVKDQLDLLPFENNWPESFYEDKMPQVLENLKAKKLLVESQGAQIVNLEKQKLGIAVLVKSDGGTTYLLRDLATFIFVKQQGFGRHLYVVDNRQSHHYRQLFAILKLAGEMSEGEGEHIDYGFISFGGEALSTRKGNMVLAEDVIAEAKKRVSKIIAEKNPDLRDKASATNAVAIGALKYYDLSHNRHSDFDFSWDDALDFEGNSGPYLMYAYARLSGILSKVNLQGSHDLSDAAISATERELIIKSQALHEIVTESLQTYLPNLLANYLFELAGLINKFYHESQVLKEENEKLKYLRLAIIRSAREVLGKGLNLLGIEALEEM